VYLQVGMLRIGQCVFQAEHQRFSCDSQVLHMIVLELILSLLFLFRIDKTLFDEHIVDCQVRHMPIRQS